MLCVFLFCFVLFCVWQAVSVLFAKMGHGQVERATLDKVGQLVKSLEVSGCSPPPSLNACHGGSGAPFFFLWDLWDPLS